MGQKPIHYPTFPPSFFSSLNREQRIQFNQIIRSCEIHFANKYSFSGELLKKEGFISMVYDRLLMQETVLPSGISRKMFLILLIVWFIKRSPRYKNEFTTGALIFEVSKQYLSDIPQLWPRQQIKYLAKYGWLGLNKTNKSYFVTEQGSLLIKAYSEHYKKLHDSFFSPLSL